MNQQLTTFYIGKDLYGIEVMRVQEVTGSLNTIPVPLAPQFVKGLINLRGQIATSLGLRELFGLPAEQIKNDASVVCKLDGNLISLCVDSIGDVMEVQESQFETAPEIIPGGVKRFLKGIYKIDGALLSLIDLERLSLELSNNSDQKESKSINN
ncbi:MAG: chemotaxis protein CheW [Bdellovibrionales bacterium]|nr:chemotaxis protein CheW [Bdellovibrionales bacterium]